MTFSIVNLHNKIILAPHYPLIVCLVFVNSSHELGRNSIYFLYYREIFRTSLAPHKVLGQEVPKPLTINDLYFLYFVIYTSSACSCSIILIQPLFTQKRNSCNLWQSCTILYYVIPLFYFSCFLLYLFIFLALCSPISSISL